MRTSTTIAGRIDAAAKVGSGCGGRRALGAGRTYGHVLGQHSSHVIGQRVLWLGSQRLNLR